MRRAVRNTCLVLGVIAMLGSCVNYYRASTYNWPIQTTTNAQTKALMEARREACQWRLAGWAVATFLLLVGFAILRPVQEDEASETLPFPARKDV